jgi:carbon-monoxide dehydrogenase medium subunit
VGAIHGLDPQHFWPQRANRLTGGTMKNFRYLEPESVSEATGLLQEYGWQAKAMAGGQALILLLREGLIRPDVVVSLLKVQEMGGIHQQRSRVDIGALATHRQIELSPTIKQHFPFVVDAYRTLGSVQVRNMGTLGGNLCHNAPGSDPPALLMVLDATLTIAGPRRKRTMNVEDLGTGFYETSLGEGELLTTINVPTIPSRTGCAYEKYAHRPTDIPFVGVAARVTLARNRKTCKEVRLALTGVAPTTIRAHSAESVLQGAELNEQAIAEAAHVATGETDPLSDAHASAEYRRKLVPVAVRRVVKLAWERAREA